MIEVVNRSREITQSLRMAPAADGLQFGLRWQSARQILEGNPRVRIHGQDLDLTGVRPGLYVLVQHANPERRLRELDYANNAASALVRVTWPRGRSRPPAVAVLRRCAGSAGCYPVGAK